MTSQLVIFKAYLFIFFRPPDLRSEKNSRKSTNKKNLALYSVHIVQTANKLYLYVTYRIDCLFTRIYSYVVFARDKSTVTCM